MWRLLAGEIEETAVKVVTGKVGEIHAVDSFHVRHWAELDLPAAAKNAASNSRVIRR
jgi:hypothetical protein